MPYLFLPLGLKYCLHQVYVVLTSLNSLARMILMEKDNLTHPTNKCNLFYGIFYFIKNNIVTMCIHAFKISAPSLFLFSEGGIGSCFVLQLFFMFLISSVSVMFCAINTIKAQIITKNMKCFHVLCCMQSKTSPIKSMEACRRF